MGEKTGKTRKKRTVLLLLRDGRLGRLRVGNQARVHGRLGLLLVRVVRVHGQLRHVGQDGPGQLVGLLPVDRAGVSAHRRLLVHVRVVALLVDRGRHHRDQDAVPAGVYAVDADAVRVAVDVVVIVVAVAVAVATAHAYDVAVGRARAGADRAAGNRDRCDEEKKKINVNYNFILGWGKGTGISIKINVRR